MIWGQSLTRLIFVFFVLLSACTSNDKRADTAEGAFEIAKEFEAAERYDEAIKRYQEVRTKFPYSRFSVLAELAVADAYYKQESYPEAQVAYQSFKDLHPKHARADYVTFKLGMSYFMQLPPTIDRDLTLATSAILFFDELTTHHPNSEHIQEAKEKKNQALRMLAEKEDYIANFYFIREKYDSALARDEGLIKNYPNQGLLAQSLSRAAISATKIGELDRAKKHLNQLEKNFPNSSELSEAKRGMKK